MDTQTAVLVSTTEVWISAPDTQTPIFLRFSWYTQLTLVFLPGKKIFGYFPEVPVTKIRVSAPAPYKNPTVIFLLGEGKGESEAPEGWGDRFFIEISGEGGFQVGRVLRIRECFFGGGRG